MAAPSPYSEALATVPTQEREIGLLGASARYWVYGPDDAEHTLVLIHGYRGDHHGLEPVVAQLPGIRIVAPDLPGFGASAALRDREHSIAGYVDWLREFVRATGLGPRIALLGHSFGSIVAAHAVAAGLEVSRLMLVNPISADPMAGVGGLGSRLARLYYRLGAALPERAGEAVLRNRIPVLVMSAATTTTRDRALRRWIREEHNRYFSGFASRRSLAEGFEASLSTDVSRVAAEVVVPTLLIAGERDRIAPLASQRAVVERFPDARLEVIPGVGHLVHYETPREAAGLIRAFIPASA